MFGRWQEENTSSLFGQIKSPELLSKGWASNYLQHLSWSELCQLLPEDKRLNYLSFSWIRNPWERMVSIYSNKDPNMLEFASKQGLKLVDLDFVSFLLAIQDFKHVHLRPQHEFIFDNAGRQQIEFIGRFERFNDDFKALCSILQICSDTQASYVLPHKNASVHGHYRDYYDDQTRRLIAKRYGEDIEKFGYTF